MIIGKWNKSVILTYIGLGFAIFGMYLAVTGENVLFSFMCLMLAGVCDMFDGKIARMCKRNQEEIEFGIELDSLVDVVCFVVLPISLITVYAILLKNVNHFTKRARKISVLGRMPP